MKNRAGNKYTNTLPIRPHHLLCTLCFQGFGYSPLFVAHYWRIKEAIGQPMMRLIITHQTDAICAPCPHKKGRTCAKQEKITRLDHHHANALYLKDGETLTWQQAQKRIQKNLSMQTFHRICQGCAWKNSGLCEMALKKFFREKPLKSSTKRPKIHSMPPQKE